MKTATRYLAIVLLVAGLASAQNPCVSKRTEVGTVLDCSGIKNLPTSAPKPVDALGTEFASYTVLLVPQQKGAEGFMIAIDAQQKLTFIPISSIKNALDEGAAPVRYGDVLQLVRQLSEENARLKAENDHLWKVAENRSSAGPVVVQQQPVASEDSSTRRQAQLMLLRSLLTQRSTVNMNVTDCSRLPALCVNH